MNEKHDFDKKFAGTPVDLRSVPAPLEGDQGTVVLHANATRVSHTQTDKLRALFPDLTEEKLSEVVETLHGYCAIVWRIYERLERERPDVIDELMRNRRMKGKVDSSN